MILYNRHIEEYKQIIDAITQELISIKDGRLDTNGYNLELNSLISHNKEVRNIIQSINYNNASAEEINKLYYFLSKELVIIGSDKNENALITSKRDLVLDIKAFNNITSKDNSINKELYSLISWIDKTKRTFSNENPEVLIVTAVPNEFRALYKKINVIFSVNKFNKRINNLKTPIVTEFYQLLSPNYDKHQRDYDYAINCIISRDGKHINVIVVLLKDYGSDNSRIATEILLDKHKSISEVNLIGIAGHMSSNPNVKIGHLIISTGFYNSSLKKINQNSNLKKYNPKDGELDCKYEFVYTEPIKIENDLNGFSTKNWKPTRLIEICPIIKNIERESSSIEIHIGYFVSGYEVVKDIEYKEEQLEVYNQALAIEMEIVGCYEACYKRNKVFNTFKAICDWADYTKSSNWQPYSADIAAEFTVDYLIEKYGVEQEN